MSLGGGVGAIVDGVVVRAVAIGIQQTGQGVSVRIVCNLPRLNKPPLSVSVIPSTKKRTLLNPHINKVTLFISGPDDREISDAEALGTRWGLTSLESRIVLLLIKGQKSNRSQPNLS